MKIRWLIFMLVMYSNETVIYASIYEVLKSRIYMVDIDKKEMKISNMKKCAARLQWQDQPESTTYDLLLHIQSFHSPMKLGKHGRLLLVRFVCMFIMQLTLWLQLNQLSQLWFWPAKSDWAKCGNIFVQQMKTVNLKSNNFRFSRNKYFNLSSLTWKRGWLKKVIS